MIKIIINNFYRIIIFLSIICSVGVVSYANGLPERLTQKGRNFYIKGNYIKATEEFERAVLKRPQVPELLYNTGTSAYMADDFQKANQYLQTNIAEEIDSDVAASTYFTLGNIQVKSAISLKQSDPSLAISSLEEGIVYFERSLKLKLDNNTAINLEIARRMLKELRDQNPPQNSNSEESDEKQNNNNQQESEQKSEKVENNSSIENNKKDEENTKENDNLETAGEEEKFGEITPEDIIKEEADNAVQRAERIIKVIPVNQDW